MLFLADHVLFADVLKLYSVIILKLENKLKIHPPMGFSRLSKSNISSVIFFFLFMIMFCVHVDLLGQGDVCRFHGALPAATCTNQVY